MEFVQALGVSYYFDNDAVPEFVQHKVRFLVGKFGNDLDAAAPAWARLKASQYLRRWGLTN
jgi:hypothetical protein